MARGKKKESALTPEEKLAQALVPVDEQPCRVPENWCWTTLGSLVDTSKEKTEDFSDPDVKYVGLEHLEKDAGIIGSASAEGVKSLKNVFHPGQILYGKLRPYLNKHDVADFDGVCSTDILVFNVRKTAIAQYVDFFLSQRSFIEYAVANSKGINLPRVSEGVVLDAVCPLPPLAEQQRIVDRIEYLFAKLDEAKEKAQSVLDSLETRKAAILHKAFTGELTAQWRTIHGGQIDDIDMSPLDKSYDIYDVPHDLPKSWRWVRFNDCCTFVGSGVTPKGGKEVYQTTGVPFIRSQNVLKGTLDLSDVAYITFETDATMKRTRILGGETLFNITGASIGRACFVPLSQKTGNVNQHVCILRYKNYVISELPQFWLNSPAVQDFVIGNQIGQTRQALNFKQIRGMYYPLAPMGEQVEILRILDSLFVKEQQAKEAAEAVLEKIDLLKKSILARAFRGELGTNDPTEESALELLKRVLN